VLTGHTPWRRVDIGEYRVIFRFDDSTIYVPVVGKRNDSEVYRHLPR
jgi:mRNA interferase RelE/StbE